MALSITPYGDSRQFLAAAGEMLYARETVNNLILGISERLIREPDAYQNPFFAAIKDEDGQVIVATVMTPPFNIVLAGIEDFRAGLPVLVNHLLANRGTVPGVTGPVQMVESFSQIWFQMTGQISEVTMRQRVYELRQVQMPPIPQGGFRSARQADVPLMTDWWQAFEAEALHETHPLNPAHVEKLVAKEAIFVWDQEGEPVAVAMKTWPIARSISVSLVYAPPEHRRKGYATALVAYLSQHLLEMGYDFVNLFTDLDNPTSNAIYQKIGYNPVADFRMVTFREPDADRIDHTIPERGEA